MSATSEKFRRFLTKYPGGPRPGLSWAEVASWAEAQPVRFERAVESLLASARGEFDLSAPVGQIRLEDPPTGTDYERWGEKKRRRANLNALAALRQFQAGAAAAPSPQERRAMEAYSAWGGFDDVHLLPPDVRLFPPEYVQAIQTWRKAVEANKVPMGPGADLFRGLRQQYFTGLDVATAMWRLACRAAPFPVREVLETSAGIGRFLRSAQDSGVRWTAVEMDTLLAEFLRALYPTAEVHAATFEAFAREVSKAMAPGSGWDLIIGNPPYPERPTEDRDADPKYSGWKRADTYFAARGASLLRPGGVLVYLTPMSNIVGSSGENQDLRAALLKQCHFAGAMFPPASIFPNITVQLCVHVWVRRAEATHELTPFEREVILPGKYLETPEGQANTIGIWKKRRTQHGDEVPYVDGRFSSDSFDYAQLYPLAPAEYEALCHTRGDVGAPVLKAKSAKATAASVETGSPLLVSARSLSARLTEFFRRLGQGPAEVALAEAGRVELQGDLRTFYATYGNPSELRELKADRKRYAPLLAALLPDGSLAPGVAEAVATLPPDAPPEGASPHDVVAFFSHRNGLCTDVDLSAYFTEDVGEELIQDPDIAVEFRPDGTRWWYRNEEYQTGNLYTRLELIETTLPEVEEEGLRSKLDDQKALLLGALGERELADIDVTPRSGFVPPECLADWINDVLYKVEVARTVGVRWEPKERKKDLYHGQVARVQRRSIGVYVEDGRLRLDGIGELHDEDVRWLALVSAYWNRSLRVEDPTEKTAGRKDAFGRDAAGVEERIQAEERLVTSFKAWLAESAEWGPKITHAYNRAYQGFKPRAYDSGPIPIARLGPHPRGYTLQAHQNSSVRRLADRGGGILALDVGLGKTASALANIALSRQEGKANRALIVVPNSVLGKWWREATDWLPTYRIGVIGLSMGLKGVRSDSPEERAEKWNKLAQGAYDLCLVSQDLFMLDVALSDERTMDIVGSLFWLQRDLGLGKEEKRLLERRIKEGQEKLDRYTSEIAVFEKELQDYAENKAPFRWTRKEPGRSVEPIAREVRTQLKEKQHKAGLLQASIADWQSKLADPTSSEIEKARAVASGFVTDRPFRPTKDRPMIEWGALGVDMLIADEAHAYKNIWRPSNRYGQSIKYMGGMEQKASKGGKGRRGEEDEEGSEEEDTAFGKTKGRRTIRAWDFFLKTQDLLERTHDRGVVLLTATPVTNSPLEVYNLVSLVSREVWISRQVRSKEEFVDRYCKFEEQLVADGIAGTADYKLAMTEFVALDELRGILNLYVDYRTTQDVLTWQEANGVPPERRLRVPTDVPERVALAIDPVQREVYQKLRHHIVEEQKKLREAKAPPKEIAALNLVLSDLLSKAAMDPRLLIEDVESIQQQIPREKDPAVAARLARRLGILNASGAAEAAFLYRQAGTVPEKYLALARNVASRPGAGHVVFSDYKMAHDEIIRVLVQYAGIPRERIVTLTGDDDKADRGAIASGQLLRTADGAIKSNTGGFNGRDPVVKDEGTEYAVVLDPGADPDYDVIIGTSGAMSEGIDLQRRSAAVHHLNYTWVPATIQQRNGRAVRQGNKFGTVMVWYYLSEQTIDVVRLSVTWGKSNWLSSLFGEAQSIANPGAAMGSDVEEAIAEMFAANPEEAHAELQRVKKEREAERLQKMRAAAQARFVSLVGQYQQYRNIQDPVVQATKMAIAEHTADQLRALPRSVFGRPNLLVQARTEPVFYDLESGIYFTRGSRFSITLKGVTLPRARDPLEDVTARVEILDFRTTVGRDSVAYWIEYRMYGFLRTHTATSLRGLVAEAMPHRSGQRFPVPTEGGTLVQTPASWSTEDELAELIVRSPVDLAGVGRAMVRQYGPQLWAKFVATVADRGVDPDIWIPVRHTQYPGLVLLMAAGGVGYVEKDVDLFSPLYPADEASWRAFCEALRRGHLFYFNPLERVGKAAVRALDLKSNPEWEHTDRAKLAEVARVWFSRVQPIPEALFVEAARHAAGVADPLLAVRSVQGVAF